MGVGKMNEFLGSGMARNWFLYVVLGIPTMEHFLLI